MTTISLDAPTPDPEPRATPAMAGGETTVEAPSRVAQADALTPSGSARPAWTAVRSAVSVVRRVGAVPDIVKEPRPPLREIWLYETCGKWTGDESVVDRRLGMAYALIAIPVIAVGYLLLWAVERPSRAAVAALIYVLLRLAL